MYIVYILYIYNIYILYIYVYIHICISHLILPKHKKYQKVKNQTPRQIPQTRKTKTKYIY